MVYPTPGFPITARFKQRTTNPGQWTACGWHTGLDVGCPANTPIRACTPGDLRSRNYGAAFGIQVTVSGDPGVDPFGDGEVFYAHLSRVNTALLDRRVEAGDIIGWSGATGAGTGPHLHVELHSVKKRWDCGILLDPQQAFDWEPPDAWEYPKGTKVYQKYLAWKGHELNADGRSTSIGAWQDMLNHHSIPGGATLPVSEQWHEKTADETGKCQEHHLPPRDQPLQAVFVGSKQFAHVKTDTGAPYEFVPDGDDPSPAPWLAKGLASLRAEVDALFPGRDKASDGWIGDQAHCGPGAPPSEHCPDPASGVVRAVDIDADLGGQGDARRLADLLVAWAKNDDDRDRLYYVIYDGRIASGTYPDTFWTWRPYTGPNPHRTHLHISAYAAADSDSTGWGLAEAWTEDEVTRAEFDALAARVKAIEASMLQLEGTATTMRDTFERHTHGKPIV